MNFLGIGGGYQIKKASEGHDLIIVIHGDGHEVWDPTGFQEFGLLHSPVNGWVFPDRSSTSILRWADPYGMPYEHSRAFVISRETPNPLEVPEIINRAVTAAISRGSEGNINKNLKLGKGGGITAGDWFFYSMLAVFLVTFFFGNLLAPNPIIEIDAGAVEQILKEGRENADTGQAAPTEASDGSGGPGAGSPAGGVSGDSESGQSDGESIGGAVIPRVVDPTEGETEAMGGEDLPGQGGP